MLFQQMCVCVCVCVCVCIKFRIADNFSAIAEFEIHQNISRRLQFFKSPSSHWFLCSQMSS